MSVPATCLLIAACAYHHGARVEHEDADFDAIERVKHAARPLASASTSMSTPMPGASRSGMRPFPVSIGPSNLTISWNIGFVYRPEHSGASPATSVTLRGALGFPRPVPRVQNATLLVCLSRERLRGPWPNESGRVGRAPSKIGDNRKIQLNAGGESMTRDRHGNPLSGADAKAAEAYDTAVAQVGIYRGDPLGVLDAVLRDAPQMVMGHVAKAWLMAIATEPAATVEGRRVVAAARALPADERESSHLAALALVLDARWDESALALERHSARWPKDILALQAGHLADFFRGNARALRDRIARALPHWSTDTPGGALVLGMYSFGLEEMGDYARAEDAGRRALDAEPLDCWAHHAVTHVMEMQGRAEDGVAWMAARERWWSGDDNFFKIHNHWHRALFHLDLGQPQAALALYDDLVRQEPQRRGAGPGRRLGPAVAPAAPGPRRRRAMERARRGLGRPRRRPLLSLQRLARRDGLPGRRARRRRRAHRAPTCARLRRKRRRAPCGSARAACRWWKASAPSGAATTGRRPSGCCPRRSIANRFGGSHAQRDVIDWTLTEAALRAGLDDLAEALAHERLALKPHSPVNLGFASRAGRMRTSEGSA